MQFHTVFDDQFSIVASVEKETDPLAQWEELCLESSVRIRTDTSPSHLGNDWLTDEEQEIKICNLQRETTIWDAVLLRIGPKPHDARAAPVEREHAPTSDPTSVDPPTPSGLSIDQGDTTPRVSSI
jgi:hypothetical protein